jgi:hypothetical protein
MLDLSKLKTGDLIAAAGGVLLIVSLFLDWFSGAGSGISPELQSIGAPLPAGIPGAPSAPKVPSVSGWDSLGFMGYVLLLTGMVALKQAGVRVAGLKPRGSVPIAAVTTALGGVAISLVIWRMFAPVADADLKVGIFLALVATLAIGAGGYLAGREDGFDFYEADK